ncbi:putative transposase/invertase (TIGR01784 family) [Pullulanibacillus pueri]|nr:putative transposase/invertase (TIGR01784 family) [Pullulanibacillus pueri]
MDIYAITKENVHINIEIQMANKNDMKERTLYYWSRIFAGQMEKGKAYSDLTQTITINILNFRLLKETSMFHTSYHLYEDVESFCLTDVMEIHFIEIPKLLVQWKRG